MLMCCFPFRLLRQDQALQQGEAAYTAKAKEYKLDTEQPRNGSGNQALLSRLDQLLARMPNP